MTHTGKLLLRNMKGLLNSVKYCDLLMKGIIPRLNSDMESFILQPNNIPYHNSKYTNTTIKAVVINILNWLIHSPDISPIDKIWFIILFY